MGKWARFVSAEVDDLVRAELDRYEVTAAVGADADRVEDVAESSSMRRPIQSAGSG
jgi:hypothetical protein